MPPKEIFTPKKGIRLTGWQKLYGVGQHCHHRVYRGRGDGQGRKIVSTNCGILNDINLYCKDDEWEQSQTDAWQKGISTKDVLEMFVA